MIVLAAASAVLYVTLLIELWRLQDRHAKAEAAWTEERRELLNRIQAPERLPMQALEPLELPELTEEQIRHQRAWQQIGEVVSIDESYGRD